MRDTDEISGTDSEMWCALAAGEDQAGEEEDLLWPYIGDRRALQEGTVHRLLLTELRERGITPQIGREVPLEDPLARYKDIPLHACFLYTSMDSSIEPVILKHYATVDGLSRDRCDIYLSMEQFNNPGETLDYLENSPVLRESGVQIGYHELPGMFFWDHQWDGEFISFGSHVNELEIKTILYRVFEEIRHDPTIAAVRRAKKLLRQ